ncbi:structural maintenance of chromosomes protein 5-like [Thunnus albacares]|uniref:structural maintenance of chromosomes protein 5-like n=1 Tax=Thunnus albacares TaxID=8236 RepID=UPI001CF6AE15|nr:structural maintenance of chromosomes protein 5-like [Thunnus albacares]
MKDLHLAVQWVHSDPGVFAGEVKEPTFLSLEEEDQQKVLKVVLEGEDLEAKDPFMFVFEKMEDMEVFLTACWDQQGLKVNSACINPYTLLWQDTN